MPHDLQRFLEAYSFPPFSIFPFNNTGTRPCRLCENLVPEDWPSLFRLEVSYRLLMPKVRQFPVGAVAQVVSGPRAGKLWQKKTGAGRE